MLSWTVTPLLRQRDGPHRPLDAWLSSGSAGGEKGGENPAAFIIQERNRTKAEQCSVTKKGCLLSELGQRLVEICQKYHKEKYRVITISIALRVLRWQNIFNDCFCLVESIIS